jgi:hypothetical protein
MGPTVLQFSALLILLQFSFTMTYMQLENSTFRTCIYMSELGRHSGLLHRTECCNLSERNFSSGYCI